MSVVFDVEKLAKKNFQAKIQGNLISELMLVDCQTVEQEFHRSTSKIARDGMDHFLIQLFLTGGTGFELKGERQFCDSTQLIIIDTTKPWKAHNPAFRNLTLVVPRRLMRSRLWDLDAHHGRILDPKTNPFAEILRSHILSLHNTIGRIHYEAAHSLNDPSLDLIAMALNHSSPDQGKRFIASDESYLNSFIFRIKAFVEDHLSDSKLSPEMIQSHFNLTRSTLYRLFPASGGIMKYIRERRMIKAYKLLSMTLVPGQTIAEIAHGLGFENESSFTRAFKVFFGVLPSEVRKGISPSQLSSPIPPYRTWESWLLSL